MWIRSCVFGLARYHCWNSSYWKARYQCQNSSNWKHLLACYCKHGNWFCHSQVHSPHFPDSLITWLHAPDVSGPDEARLLIWGLRDHHFVLLYKEEINFVYFLISHKETCRFHMDFHVGFGKGLKLFSFI